MIDLIAIVILLMFLKIKCDADLSTLFMSVILYFMIKYSVTIIITSI